LFLTLGYEESSCVVEGRESGVDVRVNVVLAVDELGLDIAGGCDFERLAQEGLVLHMDEN